jgi:hypothetical protein
MGRERRFIFDPPKLSLPVIRPSGTRSRRLSAIQRQALLTLVPALGCSDTSLRPDSCEATATSPSLRNRRGPRSDRSPLRNRLLRVEPMTVGAVPFAARCATTLSPAVEAAALLAFRRRFLTRRPRSRSGTSNARQAKRQWFAGRAFPRLGFASQFPPTQKGDRSISFRRRKGRKPPLAPPGDGDQTDQTEVAPRSGTVFGGG